MQRPNDRVPLLLFLAWLVLPIPSAGQNALDTRSCSTKSENGLYHFYVQADLGPFGKAFIPELTGSQQTSNNTGDARTPYYFPSIYFTISVSRAIAPVKKGSGTKEDTDFENWHRYPQWIEITFTLREKKEGEEKRIRVLRLIPDDTKAIQWDKQAPVALSDKAASLFDTTAQIVPVPHATVVGGSLKSMQVLFESLFPPSPIPTGHAFMTGPQAFGWFWFPDPANESLLGMRRTAALLQLDEGVKSIEISYLVKMKWNRDFSAKYSKEKDIGFDDEQTCAGELKNPDFGKLKDLVSVKEDSRAQVLGKITPAVLLTLPLLLPLDVASEILQVEHKKVLETLRQVDSGAFLVDGWNGKTYVRRKDIETFLLGKQPPK